MNRRAYNLLLSAWVENIVGKGKIARLRAISPFPTMFSEAVWCWCVKTVIYGVNTYETLYPEWLPVRNTWQINDVFLGFSHFFNHIFERSINNDGPTCVKLKIINFWSVVFWFILNFLNRSVVKRFDNVWTNFRNSVWEWNTCKTLVTGKTPPPPTHTHTHTHFCKIYWLTLETPHYTTDIFLCWFYVDQVTDSN